MEKSSNLEKVFDDITLELVTERTALVAEEQKLYYENRELIADEREEM